MVVLVVVLVPPSAKQLLKESMDSNRPNVTYFNKDIERIGPITLFVRYCVELPHRVDGLIGNEIHTLFTAYLHEELYCKFNL